MLTRRFPHYIGSTMRAGQRGVVLVIALIVMVAMTLAAIALIRSVDTTNIIAGNLAFQQAAIHSGDAAIEKAIEWLENCNSGTNGCTVGKLDLDDASNGYSANGTSTTSAHNPSGTQTWDVYWRTTLDARKVTLPTDAAGNTPHYVIDRMCANTGAPTGGANCAKSPSISYATGNEEEANTLQLNAPSLVYYRITVRTTGPRDTVSFLQAMVAL